MNADGGNSAQTPENRKESFKSLSMAGWEASYAPTLASSSDITLDEAIAMHLVDCDTCRKVAEMARPVGIGQRSGHCEVYWGLQLLRADSEGTVNNIVAYTEYGDEAPKGGKLE